MELAQASRVLHVILKHSSTPADHVRAITGNAHAINTSPWVAYVPIALVAIIGVIITWHAFNVASDWERHRVQQVFRSSAIDRVLMIQREIEQSIGIVQDIGSFFDASTWVGRRDFRKYVGPVIKRHAYISALQWIPRVTETDRASFEEAARLSFSKFRIIERNQTGELVRAERRPVHFPILYV